MRAWWRGTALVAERGIVENVRSRTFKVVTGLLLVLSAAAVILPQLLRSDETTYVLATTQPAAAGLTQALEAAGSAGGFTVSYDVRADDAAVRQAVRDGDATAGLVGDTLYTSMASGTFPVLVAQSLVALEASERLVEAGLSPAQIAEVQSVQPPRQVDVGRVEGARAVVGFAVGIVLFLALTFAGNAIATTVAMEKSTRISEVLLAVLRPSQALVGTVAAVGAVTLVQLLVLVTPVAVAVQVMDDIELPPVAGGDLAIAVIWFVLGFALYAFLFAASASLVDKITEVSSAVLPVTLVLTASYLVAITVVAADPEGPWGVLASIFPFTAPIAMPIRWAGGQVPVAQLLLAMALTAAAAVLLVWLASAIYRRALVITGRRVRVSEVFGTRTDRP
ncbi:ABC transporter permease [Humibacillus xanthopallidus]|uniref:ABC transporter permease n=1 Tax=Humibacillus xanthopallidus TaxID=412689 RepID=UPI00384E3CB1